MKKRIQFDLTQPMVYTLDQLVEQTGATTRSEVIRRAIDIYRRLLDERLKGSVLVFVDKNGQQRQVEFI